MTLRYTGGVIRAAAPTVSSSSATGFWLISQILRIALQERGRLEAVSPNTKFSTLRVAGPVPRA